MVEKGQIFTLDMVLAFSLITLSFVGLNIYYSINQEVSYESQEITAENAMESLNFKLRNYKEIDTSDLRSEYLNRSLLEVVGTLWLNKKEARAQDLINKTLGESLEECFSFSFEGQNIYTKEGCGEIGESVAVANRIATGYYEEEARKGYAARGYLSTLRNKLETKYIFFGGFVGEGNLTHNITLSEFSDAENATLEMDLNSSFDLLINGNYSGSYTPETPKKEADIWYLNSSQLDNFKEGENRVEFLFNNLGHIAGGFFEVEYNKADTAFVETKGKKKNHLPGIDGIINLYSGFSVPGTLKNMDTFLHYANNANNTIFMRLGNSTIYESNETGEVEAHLSDSRIQNNLSQAGLSYETLSNTTVPFRVGTKAYGEVTRGKADVILITDVSGSMDWTMVSDSTGESRDCGDPGLYDNDTKRISVAKCVDKDFVDKILNYTGNRVGLVSFEAGVSRTHNLSENTSSLKSQINQYEPGGGTCICCAENQAYQMLNSSFNKSRNKFVIVMSDGIPTHACDPDGLYCCEWGFLGCNDLCCHSHGTSTDAQCNPYGCGGGSEDCSGTDCIGPMKNANYSSWRLYNYLNTTVHSVGFGPVSNCKNANETLRWISESGNGSYYYSRNASELSNIYSNIAGQINSISYSTQTVVTTGDVAKNELYHDSYINLSFDPAYEPGYGEIEMQMEGEEFGDDQKGTFYYPDGTTLLDAKATSYSADYWTDRLNISNGEESRVYELWKYGTDYNKLGDPYFVYIPPSKAAKGENIVEINTGLSKEETKGASPDSQVIYTLGVDTSVPYGKTFEKYEGGKVNITTEFGNNYNLSFGNSSDTFYPNLTNLTKSTERDALDDLVKRILTEIDPDGNDKINLRIKEEDINITNQTLGEIPYLRGPGVFSLKVWRK